MQITTPIHNAAIETTLTDMREFYGWTKEMQTEIFDGKHGEAAKARAVREFKKVFSGLIAELRTR